MHIGQVHNNKSLLHEDEEVGMIREEVEVVGFHILSLCETSAIGVQLEVGFQHFIVLLSFAFQCM